MVVHLRRPSLPAPPDLNKTKQAEGEEALKKRLQNLEAIIDGLINELERYAFVSKESVNMTLTTTVPNAGSGLVISEDALGYYTDGKRITGTVTGTFVVSEKVVQATTNAEGIIYLVESGSIVVHPLTGTFTGTGSGATVTGQTSGATIANVTVTDQQALGAIIDSSGNFYFAGDDGNYIAWNGTALEVRGSLIADDLTTGTINGLVAEFAALDAPSNVTIGASQTVITSSSSTGAWWNNVQPAVAYFTDTNADFAGDGVTTGDYLKVGTKLYYITHLGLNTATGLFVTSPISIYDPGGSGSITYTIIRASTSGAIEVDEDGTVAVPAASLTGNVASGRMSTDVVAAINAGLGNIDAAKMQTNAIAAVNASSGTIDVDHGGIDLSSYAAGDMLYASGTTTLAKRAKGTAGQMLAMNAGATAPEWKSSPAIKSGFYVGDDSSNQTVDVGFDIVRVSIKNNRNTSSDSPIILMRSQTTITITGTADAGGGDTTLTASAAHGLAVGDRVFINTTSPDNMIGSYRVKAIGGVGGSETTFDVDFSYTSSSTGVAYFIWIFAGNSGDSYGATSSEPVKLYLSSLTTFVATANTIEVNNNTDSYIYIAEGVT